ncbi:mannosyltransferase [Paracoccidioides lutzii Pb01]|uniref:Dol-P-Man:Man(5)GlcNAc(2)-PP-Dol alpha-1,3-mannosyltransferase n=1 Tax=Paracoccidioides lutzii (strain ATCC MYA-826 / Pb01) TaxID=502779 RepID=C1GUX0_PARBA|nr:mannosyltransferase [Paracoccidioides lutzii Pb01]EEH40388.2 mannosyltransferase [Paracoccidioides lutzii Pb01]
MNIYERAINVATNPKHSKWISSLLLIADIFLCALIVWKVPYTEIDWTTYMQQVSLFLSGERDYALIKGSTGPLVYPAGHVYVYSALYYLCDGGRDIFFAQALFSILYLATLVIVMWSYRFVKAPPYLFPLLVLSKRLHSVFLLRLFNDGVATFFLWAGIFALQRRRWSAGVILWSMGVGVKMTLLLVAPAVAVIAVLGVGILRAAGLGATALWLQVLFALPFLKENPSSYISRSFEFTRQFLFRWTVNWRFVGEKVFTSNAFAVALLAVHASLLGLFLIFCWIRPLTTSPEQLIKNIVRGRQLPIQIVNSFIMTTMLSSLAIGLLCARSLHYQFFAYLSWATPYLLWKSGFHPVITYLVWAAQEWAWNVYPSTTASSITVVSGLSIQVFGVFWNGYRMRFSNKEHKE